MERYGTSTLGRKVLHRVLGALAAVGLTVTFFLVLPLIQAINRPAGADTILRTVDTASLPPPPPPPPDEPEEEEPEEEEKPPELMEEAPPLDLAQLELALNPGLGEGWFGADFALDPSTFGATGGAGTESIFSLADLDQKPRPTYQPSPVHDARTKKAAPGTVYVFIDIDENGRVQDVKVQRSTDPILERPALAAVKKWRFEPGRRNGEPVRSRMRVPITFPRG